MTYEYGSKFGSFGAAPSKRSSEKTAANGTLRITNPWYPVIQVQVRNRDVAGNAGIVTSFRVLGRETKSVQLPAGPRYDLIIMMNQPFLKRLGAITPGRTTDYTFRLT